METNTQKKLDINEDDKDVRQIIDQLKSQGLFDQFRKDFLADVDTKPAYQNLTQRVEGYVNRFLSRQKWSQKLNKNQLRDNLRRQINQSGMLINGAERVINQVVDPKILQVIKPKIDEVVCAHFGIDLKERQQQQEAHKLQQQQKLQNLMNEKKDQQQTDKPPHVGSSSFPPGQTPDMWQQHQQHQNVVTFPGSVMNFPMATPFPQQMPFGMPPQMFPYMQGSWNPFMFPPGQFTSLPPGTSTVTTINATSSVPAINSSSITVAMSNSTIVSTNVTEKTVPPKPDLPPLPPTPPPPGTEVEDQIVEESLKPKVLEDIPLPPPSSKKSNDEMVLEEEAPSLDEIPLPPNQQIEDTVSKRPYKFAWEMEDIDIKSDITVSSVHTSDLSDDFEDEFSTESELEYSDLTDHGNDEDEDDHDSDQGDEKIMKKEDKMTDASHSEFEKMDEATQPEVVEKEVSSNDTKDNVDVNQPPELEAVLETVPPVLEAEADNVPVECIDSQEDAEALPPEITSESDTITVEAEVTAIAMVEGNGDGNISSAPPELTSVQDIDLASENAQKQASVQVEEEQFTFEATIQNISEGLEVSGSPTLDDNLSQSTINAKVAQLEASINSTQSSTVSPPKKKLVSLQYNYSDSEEEETREQRKARIAQEKEERYMKRQQRRAELEAKRKERDHERARLREERKKIKEKEKLSMESKEKKDSEEKTDEYDASQDDSSQKDSPGKKVSDSLEKRNKQPRSPEKKNKKSKAELKEELVKQKVMEKKAALRRQRTRNRRYTSEEFTSIFNEKQQPYSSQSYSDMLVEEQVVEETVSTMDYNMDLGIEYHSVDITEEHTEEAYQPMPGTPTQDELPEPLSDYLSQTPDSHPRHTRSMGKSEEDNQANQTEEFRKGSKRKRNENEERNEDSNGIEPDAKGKPSKVEEDKVNRSKRYVESDLYKPHRGNKRRGSSPSEIDGTGTETSNTLTKEKVNNKPGRPARQRPKPTPQLPPEDEIIEITSRSPTPQPRSKSRSYSRSTSRSYSHSRSRSRSRSHSNSKLKKKRRRRKKVKKRSRSHSGSVSNIRDGASPISSSSLSISDSSRSRHSSRSSISGSKSTRSKSRSRSRSSESSVDEFGRRKRKAGSIPLDYVDFGEAAKMARRSLVGVDFGEAERRSKQERGMPGTTLPGGGAENAPYHKGGVPPLYGVPAPGPSDMNPYNANQRRQYQKRAGFPQRVTSRGVPRTNALRKNWFHSGWQYQDSSSTGPPSGSDMRGSPPMSPGRRYYESDQSRSPLMNEDLESLSPESEEELSSRSQSRGYRSRLSPHYAPHGRRSLSPVSMYPYDDPVVSPSHMHRGVSSPYMRDRSLSPLSSPHARGRRTMSPPSPHMRSRRSPVSPPPHMRVRHSDSSQSPPPYNRDRRSRSPLTPPHLRGRTSLSRSPPPRSQSPYSPVHMRGHRSPSSPPSISRGPLPPSPDIYPRRGQSPPSPPLRGQRSPTPEEYPNASPSIHRPITRGYRSPSHSPPPPGMSRSPSPPRRPVTRGYHSPSNSPSPPSRPMTRGRRPVTPPIPGSKKGPRIPSPPPVSVSSRLRARHTAPDRYSPPIVQRGKQRPPSPPPQGKADKKKR